MNLNSHQILLCETQGNLFEMTARRGLDSKAFVKTFMNSETARQLDRSWSHAQWAGEAYLLDELNDVSGGLPHAEYVYHPETMSWMGYLYRYWHFYTGESSAKIYRHVDAETMAKMYLGYHTLDCEMAIDRILETRP